jgi:hypothetical protein
VIGLTTAYTTGPTVHIEIVEGAIEGMDLADLVVELPIFSLAGFPKATMNGLHPGRRKIGLHYPQIKGQSLQQLLGIAISLRGKVTRIHPNHWNFDPTKALGQLAQLMQQHRRLNAKAGGQREVFSKGVPTPAQSSHRITGFQPATGLIGIQGLADAIAG